MRLVSNMLPVAVSWSGGKDSCLACYQAMADGFRVSHLLNFITKDGTRIMSHGLDSRLIFTQSQALGIPIIQREVTWDTYEEGFKTVVRELKEQGVKGVVFGDIDLQEHREWNERVCGEIGIEPILPLWGWDAERVVADLIEVGFEAIVVAVKADLMGEEWLGRRLDHRLVQDLRQLQERFNLHLCGESGEYHTFVTDGPLFKQGIKIADAQRVLRDGRWFLDIISYQLEPSRHAKAI